MSFRLRLLLGLAAVVVTALAALAVGTAVAVQHNLVATLDGRLRTASASLASSSETLTTTGTAQTSAPTQASGAQPSGSSAPGTPPPDGAGSAGAHNSNRGAGQVPPPAQVAAVRAAIGPEDYVAYLAKDGSVTSAVTATVAGGAGRPILTAADRPTTAGETRVSTAASATGARERVAVTTRPDGTAVAVAGSLTPVDATVRHLVEYEIAIGAAVLLGALALGTLLARQATRPLEQIATTADAIAGGDLTRRVPPVRGASEVRRVGAAFNGMLSSIGAAFARRDATEEQLRRFVADASHELATPLTSIRGYAELFRRGLADRPADLAVALGRIEAEANRMGRLVDDLLLLARLDAAHDEGAELDPAAATGLRLGPVDLAAIASDCAADLRAADPDREVTLHVDETVGVVGDEDRLRQVAANLVSNARRHTPPGTRVTVSARREDGMAVLTVADEGPGLEAADASRVFERFYRIDKARSRAAGGTGLGLSIVAGVVEAHGGRVAVRTRPGGGAAFSVTLPLARAQGPSPAEIGS